MSAVVSFADWLRNYSSHTYKDTTVEKYEAALEKGPDWLGITLKKPIIIPLSDNQQHVYRVPPSA